MALVRMLAGYVPCRRILGMRTYLCNACPLALVIVLLLGATVYDRRRNTDVMKSRMSVKTDTGYNKPILANEVIIANNLNLIRPSKLVFVMGGTPSKDVIRRDENGALAGTLDALNDEEYGAKIPDEYPNVVGSVALNPRSVSSMGDHSSGSRGPNNTHGILTAHSRGSGHSYGSHIPAGRMDSFHASPRDMSPLSNNISSLHDNTGRHLPSDMAANHEQTVVNDRVALAHGPCLSSKTVALGIALTTRGVNMSTVRVDLPLFVDLIPSFCQTASRDFCYTMYLAHDYNDDMLSTAAGREVLQSVFNSMTGSANCSDVRVSLKFVNCSHSRSPAWAQNDAMMAGYRDRMEYYYMVNDDTILVTPDWANKLADVLGNFQPPDVGLLGPATEGRGNPDVFNYNFVHRTHIDIFGYFYPRNFTDWFADNWASFLYYPKKSLRVKSVVVNHVGDFGRRYTPTKAGMGRLRETLINSRIVLRDWLRQRQYTLDPWQLPRDLGLKGVKFEDK